MDIEEANKALAQCHAALPDDTLLDLPTLWQTIRSCGFNGPDVHHLTMLLRVMNYVIEIEGGSDTTQVFRKAVRE